MRRIAVLAVLVVPLVVLSTTSAGAVSALTITPHTGLIDGQSVHLTATGLPPDSFAGIRQCVSGHELSGCDPASATGVPTDGFGGFSTDFQVRTIMHTDDGVFDCRVAACVIGTNTTLVAEGAAFGPISFDPSGPLLPPPTVTGTPTTGLVDGDVVAVTGSGFRAPGFAAVIQCQSGATTLTQCRTSGAATGLIDPAGTFAADYTVHTIFVTGAGTTVDCRTAADTCELQLLQQTGDAPIPLPVSFNPSAPAPPPPTVAVSPDSGLIDGQTVHLVGSDFPADTTVGLGQCVTAPSGGGSIGTCSFGLLAQTDASGGFTADFVVHTRVWAGQILDCRDADTVCAINAQAFTSEGVDSYASLHFAPDGPLLPLPDLQATPSTDLLDGDVVTLTGANWALPYGPIPVESSGARDSRFPFTLPAQPASAHPTTSNAVGSFPSVADPSFTMPVFECVTGAADLGQCAYDNGVASIDGDGNLTGSMQVAAVFQGFDGSNIDCREAGVQCELMAGYTDDPLSSATAPLSFDPNGPLRPPPTLTVTPDTGLHDGTAMHVVGDGFPANTIVGFHQCQAGTTGMDTCDEAGFGSALTDANGHLDAMTTAKQVLQYGVTWGPDGTTVKSTYDCGTAPNGCRFLAADYKPPTAWPSVGLLYAGSGGGGGVTPIAQPNPGTETTPAFTG